MRRIKTTRTLYNGNRISTQLINDRRSGNNSKLSSRLRNYERRNTSVDRVIDQERKSEEKQIIEEDRGDELGRVVRQGQTMVTIITGEAASFEHNRHLDV